MTIEKEILGRLEVLTRMVGALKPKAEAPLTISAFARATGYCSKTISKKIRAGQIVTKLGRIPASELQKFQG